MAPSLTVCRFARRFAGCAAAGAGVVIFAKPLIFLTVAATVFALIGFLMWLPIHTALVIRRSGWPRACSRGMRCLALVRQAWRGSTAAVASVLECATPLVGELLLEGLSGAALAVVLAVALVGPEAKASPLVSTGALTGLLAGFLLALTRRRRQAPVEEQETEIYHGASLSSTQVPLSRR